MNETIRGKARDLGLCAEMVFGRLKKGWTYEEAFMPTGWKRGIDIQKRIRRYDDKLDYLGGYVDSHSMITLRCRRCGNTFTFKYRNLTTYYNGFKNYCACDNCRKDRVIEWYNTNKGGYTRRKIPEKQIIDKDITLAKVYEKDNGLCYICGCKCDWNVKKITGQWGKYPSIDHVIPIHKGGLHSWENVRLACVSCNAKKQDKI